MPVKILFCSQDRYFGDHLNLALSEDPRSFQVLYFTDSQRAVDFLERSGEEVQCILGSPRFLRLMDPADGLQIALGEETSMEAPLAVNMYQRRQDLVDDLKNILRANDLLAAASVRHSSTKILSFFSTQGGSGKTTLAYLTAIKAAEQGKTAYLNLETAPCVEPLYASCGTVGAEEYLCAVKDREDPTRAILPALTRNSHGVFVLPIPGSIRDQQDITGEDLGYLLESLLRYGELEYIILDLSATLGSVSLKAMEQSDRVALVYGDDRIGNKKRELFLQDPGFSTLPCAGKELIVGNQCLKKYSDGRYHVSFPHSNTLTQVSDVRAVLQGNPDMEKGCAELISF